MDNLNEAECQLYWDTNLFFHSQELNSWGLEESLSPYYSDSSSPDGIASGSKNIVSERNRRKKLNEKLFALRAVVPNITKLDKASIIKDATSYIQELHKQQRLIKTDISDLGNRNSCNSLCSIDDDQDIPLVPTTPIKKRRVDNSQKQYLVSNGRCRSSAISDLEMRVSYVGERTIVLSLTCSKKEGTVVKLCQVLEVLKLKIIADHITAFSGRLLKTVFVEADERDKDGLITKIESATMSTPRF